MDKVFRMHDGKHGSALAIRVIYGAESNKLVGVMDDDVVQVSLKVSADDPPNDKALVRFLAGELGIPPRRIEVVVGIKSGERLVSFLGIEKDELSHRLMTIIEIRNSG